MARLFTDALRDMRNGRTVTELTEELAALIAKVKETGRPGELTLKLKVRPASKSSEVKMVTVEDFVTTKLPAMVKGESVFWTTDDNSLSVDNPEQRKLDLRVAGEPEPGQSAASGE